MEERMREGRVICVLGMHRSGTSLVTRMLSLLGVYLGAAENLMPPTQNNPRGYWEHERITDLDDEVLARLGGSWDDPPPIASEMFASPELADLRRAARGLIAAEFGDARLWGWKDPRTCLVVPFWELVVPPPRYVVCIRNPLDVARSLARSDGVEHGMELWVRYTRELLVATRGRERLLLFYEDVLRDWRGELARLATFIGKPKRVDAAARAVQAEGLVDEGLWHHRTELGDALDDPRLPFEAKALYLALFLARRASDDGLSALPHGTLEAFAAAALDAAPGKTEATTAVVPPRPVSAPNPVEELRR
jgi:hypothetical protein